MRKTALSIDCEADNLARRKEKLLELQKRRKESKGKKEAGAQVTTPIVESGGDDEAEAAAREKGKKKRSRLDETVLLDTDYFADESIKLTYPAEGSFYSDSKDLLSEARKNLLPEDDKRFASLGHRKAAERCFIQAFQAMQGTIFMERELSLLSKRNKELLSANNSLKKELETSLKENEEKAREKAKMLVDFEELEKRVFKYEEEKTAELDALHSKLDILTAANVGLESKLAQIEDEKENCELAASTAMECKLMREFLEHRGVSWDPEKVIADYEEIQRMEQEMAAEEETVEDKGGESDHENVVL